MEEKDNKNTTPEATSAQRTKLFTSPFKAYEQDATVKKLATNEVKTGNALYEQGKACADYGVKGTESIRFKHGIDKRATKSGNGKGKTEAERVSGMIKNTLPKLKVASVRKLRDACNAILGE